MKPGRPFVFDAFSRRHRRGQLPLSVSDGAPAIAIPGTLGQGVPSTSIWHCDTKTGPIWSMQTVVFFTGWLVSGLQVPLGRR